MTNTWSPQKDKYGRPTRSLRTDSGRTDAVVVTLPRVWVENHGPDRYLVNLWCVPPYFGTVRTADTGRISHHRSLKAAKAWAEARVAELRAIPTDLTRASHEQLLVAWQDAGYAEQAAESRLNMLLRLGVSETDLAVEFERDRRQVAQLRRERLARELQSRLAVVASDG